jgi:NADPH2:quinone reductase
MKAVQVARFGGPEVLEVAEVARPSPGAGEVRVKLDYAGVNFIDVYMRSGHYARSHTYQTPLPMTIGMEGAGVVEALGSGVTELRVGQRVAYCIVRGSYAEFAAVPAAKLVPIPDGVSTPIATALMLQGLTAHYLTRSAYPLGEGKSCLVHAGAGGVGQLLIQLAKRRGALVIATVGSEEKAVIARERGADHVILYRDADFRDEVRCITHDRGVDVVYDSVGKDTISRSIRSLARRGLCVNYGGASGFVTSVEPLELAEAGSVYFTRPHLADYISTASELRGRAADLFAAYARHELAVAIDRELPLEQAGAAHEAIESRRTKGKLLLRIAD